MTQTTVLPDQTDESASGLTESSAPSASSPRDALGAAMLRLQGETPSPETPSRDVLNDGADTDEPASGESADTDVKPETAADSAPTSRRGTAQQARIDTLEQELQQLKAKVEQPQDQQQPTAAADDELTQAEQKIAQLRGTDADWEDLSNRVVDGLGFEDSERYRVMRAARGFEKEWNKLAEVKTAKDFIKYRDGHFASIYEAFQRAGTKPGVDAELVQTNPSIDAVFDHIYEAGRKDLADENEQLRGEIKQLKAERLGSAPRLPTGGRSSLGLTDRPDPREAEPQDLLRAGMRQRTGARR